ncbi:MAG: hypothetical protein ABTQ25_18760 [Nitrosomonas ureae]
MSSILCDSCLDYRFLHQQIAENKESQNSAEVSEIPNDAVAPVFAAITNQPVRASLSMLSESVDWPKLQPVFRVNQTMFAAATRHSA